jgi:lysophospholipase L1-like esterase
VTAIGDRPPVSRRRRLLFAVVPTVALLLVGEFVARAVRSAAPADDHAAVDFAEIARREEAGELRRRGDETLIYVYGESTVWGIPVPEIGLVAQMQFYAARRHPGRAVRVVNLGVRSADSSQIRDLVERTIGNRPDLAVVLCGHNEFVRPPGEEPLDGALRRSELAKAVHRVVSRASVSMGSPPVPPGRNAPVARSADFVAGRDARYRRNMTAVVSAAREERVPLVLATLPSNLRDWPPVFRRLAPADGDLARQDAYENAMLEALAADERRDVGALRAFVSAREAEFADDAMFLFLGGRLRFADGDGAGALADLTRARDVDPIPSRMSSSFLEFVRTLAREERTLFADLEAATADGTIPGADVIADNCHPTPEGARRMAAALLRTAEIAGVLPGPAADAWPLEDFLRDVGYAPGSSLRLRYLVFNGQYAMRRPLYHYGVAARYLDAAVAEFPSAWVAHANLATLHLLTGDVDAGKRELDRAQALRGRPLDLADRETVPYLGEILEARGMR